MSLLTRTIGLGTAVALLAAACGSAATSGSPGASSTFPNVSPSGAVGGASATPGSSASTGDLTGGSGGTGGSTGDLTGGSGGTGGTGMTGDQLVGTIPTRVADMELTVRTATPADLPLFDSSTGSTLLGGLTTALGVDPSNMTAAVGTSTNGQLTIGALDVPGVDVAKLNSTLSTAFSSAGATPNAQVGGRTVTTIPLDANTVYLYATGSTIYLVKAPTELVAEEGLVALPGPMTP